MPRFDPGHCREVVCLKEADRGPDFAHFLQCGTATRVLPLEDEHYPLVFSRGVPCFVSVSLSDSCPPKPKNGGTRAVGSADLLVDHPLWFTATTARRPPNWWVEALPAHGGAHGAWPSAIRLGGSHALYPSIGNPRCSRAARSVFRINMVIVMGPTPPGTGVIFPATFTAESKSTSPTSFALPDSV